MKKSGFCLLLFAGLNLGLTCSEPEEVQVACVCKRGTDNVGTYCWDEIPEGHCQYCYDPTRHYFGTEHLGKWCSDLGYTEACRQPAGALFKPADCPE